MKPSGKWIRRALIPALALLLALAPAGALADGYAANVAGFQQPVYLRYGDPPAGYVPGGTALTVEKCAANGRASAAAATSASCASTR